jgi:acetyl esterase/lipase
MSEDARANVAKRRVVYRSPDAVRVSVDRRRYTSSSGDELPYDVYEPTDGGGAASRPAVVLVSGYNDDGMRRFFGCAAKDLGAFESWAQLIAASGLTAIAYECREPGADARAILAHVRATAASLSVDAARIGLWACSGHVPTALATAMDEPRLGCAAFLYGYTMDLDDHREVADAAAMFRFAVPGSGRSLADVPGALPMLFVRAGADRMPGLNAAMDRLVSALLARNAPVSFVNHATGSHAFELEDDGPATRAAVRQGLTFLATHLMS